MVTVGNVESGKNNSVVAEASVFDKLFPWLALMLQSYLAFSRATQRASHDLGRQVRRSSAS